LASYLWNEKANKSSAISARFLIALCAGPGPARICDQRPLPHPSARSEGQILENTAETIPGSPEEGTSPEETIQQQPAVTFGAGANRARACWPANV
jgi:hypothetical protein